MKRNYLHRAILPLLSAIILAACSTDPVLFDESSFFVAFNKKVSQVKENGDTLLIPVDVAAFKGSPATTVTVKVLQDTGKTAAVEFVDFTIVSKTLSFPNGLGTGYIQVVPIDNNVFEGNKFFRLGLFSNTANYAFGAVGENKVTIVDDEHPLKLVLGDYIFAGLDAWDAPFSCNVTTQSVEGDLTQIQFPVDALIGYGAPLTDVVIASVDLTAKTFKIKTGQSYASFGYGTYKINGYDADGNDLSEGDFVTGTIDDNGNITMNEMLGVVITSGSYEGQSFAIFGVGAIWTKQ